MTNGCYQGVFSIYYPFGFLGLGSMVQVCRSRDDSCLHLAVQSNSLDIVKFLIDEGADVNARNSSLTTPLLLGCQHNSHMIVKCLLEK